MTQAQQRAAVVSEALSWLTAGPGGTPTPFVYGQCIKGVASDCARFPTAVYTAVGVRMLPVPDKPAQWFLHAGNHQLYLDQAKQMLAEYRLENYPWLPAEKDEAAPTLVKSLPEPGDFLVRLHRRIYFHGAIVLAWPEVIHCLAPCVMKSKASLNGPHLRFFDPWAPKGTP
jgi:hypothetical protein